MVKSNEIPSLFQIIIRALVLSLVYFQITKANDTTVDNILQFSLLFIILSYGAILGGIDPNIVAGAYMTKAVFTLVDEKIKGKPFNILNFNTSPNTENTTNTTSENTS